jgi:phenylacetic acid degradation operon negative regulatory protein
MRSSTQDLLSTLLWCADILLNPTALNMTDSYESWAYRRGIERQLRSWHRRGLLERDRQSGQNFIYRLTRAGQLKAWGGRDPVQQWNRSWDGQWHLVVFDVPESKSALRARLRRFLRSRYFGCLQKSVWISPDPLDVCLQGWASSSETVKSFISLDVRPAGGELDANVVSGAWNFHHINQQYGKYLELVENHTDAPAHNEGDMIRLQQRMRQETLAWEKAMSMDPLLPAVLLPPGYLGKKAFSKRVEMLDRFKKQLQCMTYKMSRT